MAARSVSRLVPLLACAALPCIGCGQSAILRADALPIRHVVVYRNGVAYFER